MTSDLLIAVAAVLLSLLFSYVPQAREWFEKLGATHKRLVMLGLLALAAGGSFGLACIQSPLAPAVACDQAGAWGLLRTFVLAVIANQSAYMISPKLPHAPSTPEPEWDGDPVR